MNAMLTLRLGLLMPLFFSATFGVIAQAPENTTFWPYDTVDEYTFPSRDFMPDSVLFDRGIYQVDSAGRVTAEHHVNLAAGGGYDSLYKVYYERNAQGQMVKLRRLTFEVFAQQFNEYEVVTYDYFPSGALRSKAVLEVYASPPLDTIDRRITYYDVAGNPVADSSWIWVGVNHWEPLRNRSYTYHSNGQLSSSVSNQYTVFSASYAPYDSLSYAYDAQGRMVQHASYRWESSLADWVPYTKDTILYAGPGSQAFDQYVSVWDANSSGFKLERKLEKWRSGASEFEKWYHWSNACGCLNVFTEEETRYDSLNRVVEILDKHFLDEHHLRKEDQQRFYYHDNTPFLRRTVTSSRHLSSQAVTQYAKYYSLFAQVASTLPASGPVGLPHPAPATDFMLSPNPNRGRLHLEIPEKGPALIEVMTPRGQVLFQQLLHPPFADIALDATLPNGLYLLKVTPQAGQTRTKKFLLMR